MFYIPALRQYGEAAIDGMHQLARPGRIQGAQQVVQGDLVVVAEQHDAQGKLPGTAPQVFDTVAILVRRTMLGNGALCLQVFVDHIQGHAPVRSVQ
ncbi:hypothetical protein D3C77_679360 [compost metagenome]